MVDQMMSHDPHDPSDDVILNMAPPLPVRPKLAMLDESSILGVTGEENLNSVKVCVSSFDVVDECFDVDNERFINALM